MQAILLAAGYGTRLRPYTDVRPKPLFPVVNRPLLHILLDQLRECGCERILVNCHHLADQIIATLRLCPGVLVQQEAEILGTGGGLRKAVDRLFDAPVLVMNGDLYHCIDLGRLAECHRQSGNGVTLALHDLPRFNTVGMADDRVRTFRAAGGTRLAFTGIHLVEPEVIRMIPAGCFHHVIDLYEELAKCDRVGACRVDGSFWRDMGTPEDYLHLHAELCSQGGGADPRWVIDPSARLGRGVSLMEWGCIGAGAVIGAGACLRRTVVWEGAVLEPGVKRADAIITGTSAVDRLLLTHPAKDFHEH